MAARRKKAPAEALPIQTVADILGVHANTVRNWIRHGYIRAYKVGPHLVRIPRSEVSRMRAVRLPFIINEDIPKYPTV